MVSDLPAYYNRSCALWIAADAAPIGDAHVRAHRDIGACDDLLDRTALYAAVCRMVESECAEQQSTHARNLSRRYAPWSGDERLDQGEADLCSRLDGSFPFS